MAEPTDSSAPPGESTNPATERNAPAAETVQSFAQNEPPPVETNQPSAEVSQEPIQHTEPAQSAEPPQPMEPAQLAQSAEPIQPAQPEELAAPEPPAEPTPSAAGPPQDASAYQPEEASHPVQAPDVTLPSVESSLPAIDSTLPPMDTSHTFDDADLHSFDGLPSLGSSAAPDMSLPAIDTTLPSMDHSLPAIGTDDIPTMDGHDFGDGSHLDHHDSNPGMGDSTGPGHDTNQHSSAVNGASHYHTPTNGSYQYSHSPTHSQQPGSQQSPQTHTQHQFQTQPQHYQQADMYHNSGAQAQAPIGSPLPNNMPPMTSMGQYMAGYPSNMGQGNAQMRYQLPGDPNKMLSGNRHKKEVKRRTKTGCLTCRKRRIKVSLAQL
jgi:hypothetical protein